MTNNARLASNIKNAMVRRQIRRWDPFRAWNQIMDQNEDLKIKLDHEYPLLDPKMEPVWTPDIPLSELVGNGLRGAYRRGPYTIVHLSVIPSWGLRGPQWEIGDLSQVQIPEGGRYKVLPKATEYPGEGLVLEIGDPLPRDLQKEDAGITCIFKGSEFRWAGAGRLARFERPVTLKWGLSF